MSKAIIEDTEDTPIVQAEHVRITDFRIAIDFITDQLRQGNRVSAICATPPIDNDDYGPVNIDIMVVERSKNV